MGPMRSEAHTYFWAPDIKLQGLTWSKTKLYLSEWRLERIRKQALADVITKGDRRLLEDAGIDPDNPPNQRSGIQDQEIIFGNQL